MKGFSGFSDGVLKTVSLPAQFFSELLPHIDHLAELKVTLYCFWALQAQEGKYRYISFAEASQDALLLGGLHSAPEEALQQLQEGFERATARGTLLHITIQEARRSHEIYFLNTEKGREACLALENRQWLPSDDLRPIALILERPNTFRVYEQHIGGLTPHVADELRDLERDYPLEWIQDAIYIAAENRVTHMNYIIAVLKRWKEQGREIDASKPPSDDDYLAQYGSWMKE